MLMDFFDGIIKWLVTDETAPRKAWASFQDIPLKPKCWVLLLEPKFLALTLAAFNDYLPKFKGIMSAVGRFHMQNGLLCVWCTVILKTMYIDHFQVYLLYLRESINTWWHYSWLSQWCNCFHSDMLQYNGI